MKKRLGIALTLVVCCSSWGLTAELQTQSSVGQKGAPTSSRDATPKFNMDYFVGEWEFESNLAETPLGAGWPESGTETVRNIYDGRFWDVRIKGGNDRAPVTGAGVLIYQDSFAGQFFARHQVVGGVSLLMTGEVGCDLGGTCNVYFETPPFEQNGSLLRLKGRYYLTSPVSYRLQLQISIDKEPVHESGDRDLCQERKREGDRYQVGDKENDHEDNDVLLYIFDRV